MWPVEGAVARASVSGGESTSGISCGAAAEGASRQGRSAPRLVARFPGAKRVYKRKCSTAPFKFVSNMLPPPQCSTEVSK